MRVCSLLPSATEIVGALGLTGSLVGRSQECDWPPEVREVPVVTASRVDSERLPSLAIDQAVREALSDGLPLYAVDAELIDRLRPDVIVTQDLCRVCAVSSGDLRSLTAVEAEVISLEASTIAEIEQSVLVLAERLGVPERGREVVARMEASLTSVRQAVAGCRRRRVFVSEWLDPPYAAGHWVPEMVELAGGEEVLGRPGQPSFRTTWEQALARSPELVVLAPCGFDLARTVAEARLPDLPCPAVAVDANSYFSRPAPRVADGTRLLAFLLHPEAVADPGLPWAEIR